MAARSPTLTRDDTMHNLALVEEGYATARTVPPNDKYAARFEAAERDAKQQQDGPRARCERALARSRRARALERAERARERLERRRAAWLARRIGAAERRKRAAETRAARRRRDGYSSGRIPDDCSEVDGTIPTPPGDPTNLDGDHDGKACED